MKIFLSFFLTVFTVSVSISQNQREIDSLLTKYNSSNTIENKTHALISLIDIYIFNNTTLAKKYIDTLNTISEDANYDEGIIQGQLNQGYLYYTIEKMDSAYFYLNKTVELAKQKKAYENIMIDALNNISLIHGHNGKYTKAIKLMDSIAEIHLSKKNFLNYAVSINNSAAHYYDKGDYLKAMKGYKKALDIIDTIEREPYRKADIYRNIGKLNTRQDELESALNYFNKALKTYLELDDYVYASSTYIDIGSVYSDLNKENKAIEFYKKGLEINEKSKNNSISVLAYGNTGIAYKNLGNYNLAIKNLKKGLSFNDDEISNINKAIYFYHLGNCYTNKKEFELAEKYLNKSISISKSGKIKNELINAIEYRSYNFELKGNIKKALIDLKKAQTIKDSLYTIDKAEQIKKLQTIYETEKKEAEIALQQEEIKTLNAQAKNDKLTKTLYSIGMFSFIAIAGLLFFGFKQRIKKNRIAREKQEAIYKQEIEFKKKELASQTLHLVQKSTFIQELKGNLERIKKSPELFKVEFRRLVMLLKKESAEDKDWEVFKSYFSEVHNDFDNKLKHIANDISEKETRLASFLRMNLSTKEIASMLNVLPDSVLKSKYRLKKKLNLDKETDLNQFLNTL